MKKTFIYMLIAVCLLVACEPPSSESVSKTHEPIEAPFIHSVYFWFKEGVSDEQLKAFYDGIKKLKKIEVIEAIYTGKPASTDRPIVEKGYDYAVIIHFRDLAAHDTYQKHPIHSELVEASSAIWEKVMVTDVTP